MNLQFIVKMLILLHLNYYFSKMITLFFYGNLVFVTVGYVLHKLWTLCMFCVGGVTTFFTMICEN
jgi:hypothetical protein